MSLNIQLYSMFFSYIYGLFFSLLIKVFYKYLFVCSFKKKIIYNFIFFLFISTFYFYIMRLINYGKLHIYFLLLILLGIFTGKNVFFRNDK